MSLLDQVLREGSQQIGAIGAAGDLFARELVQDVLGRDGDNHFVQRDEARVGEHFYLFWEAEFGFFELLLGPGDVSRHGVADGGDQDDGYAGVGGAQALQGRGDPEAEECGHRAVEVNVLDRVRDVEVPGSEERVLDVKERSSEN